MRFLVRKNFKNGLQKFEREIRKLDALLVYGDEYRKENPRYVSNFWPIFERAATLLAKMVNL